VERLLQQVTLGPSSARVDRVEVEWQEPTGEFERFEVRY